MGDGEVMKDLRYDTEVLWMRRVDVLDGCICYFCAGLDFRDYMIYILIIAI